MKYHYSYRRFTYPMMRSCDTNLIFFPFLSTQSHFSLSEFHTERVEMRGETNHPYCVPPFSKQKGDQAHRKAFFW